MPNAKTGGLGSPIAMYLAAAGVGHLIIADFDQVDLTNLQRQILHRSDDIGRRKTDSALGSLESVNPDIEIETINDRLDEQKLDELVPRVDIVLDGTDNFATRFAVNAACVRHRVPLVSGAAIRFEGQVSVFPNRHDDSPCYACLYSHGGETEERCSENGILAPVVGVIGSLQAVEAMKVLLGIGEPLVGRLLLMDALAMDIRVMKFRKDPGCPVCSSTTYTLVRQQREA